jgi:hypothetical protein
MRNRMDLKREMRDGVEKGRVENGNGFGRKRKRKIYTYIYMERERLSFKVEGTKGRRE